MFDKSANWCRYNWGKKSLESIPEPTPSKAVAVFMEGHIGLYIGGGTVIEMTPPHLMITTLRKREKGGKWTHWACVPAKWLGWADAVMSHLGKEPAPAPRPAPTPTLEEKFHTVGQGDTLWALAAKHLGSGHRRREIQDLNGGPGKCDPHKLRAGMILKIPKK